MPHSWRTVRGHPAFEVSDHGAVRRRLPGRGTWVGRVLSPCANGMGYLYVCLDTQRCFVHHLVCRAFHGPRPSRKHEVGHRDGRQRRNTKLNLRWVTKKQNNIDKRKHGRCKGERNPAAVLTPWLVRIIRRSWPRVTLRELGRIYGVTYNAIWLIVHRKSWGHLA